MKGKVIGLSIVLVLVVIALSTYVKNQIEASQKLSQNVIGSEVELMEGLEKGQLAPDFTLETLTGESLTLSELRGKKVVLNFWATWCPPCKDEMPHLRQYYEKYAEKDNVEIVAVNLTYNDSKIEFIENFVKGFDITFPVPLMVEEELRKTYEILTIPSTFMIDTKGRIQKQIRGPLDQAAIRDHVKELD